MRPDFRLVVEKAKAAAAEFAGVPDAAQFLVIVLQNSGNPKDAREALRVLLDQHLDGESFARAAGLAPSLTSLVGKEAADPALEKMAKSKNAKVRGWAAFARHQGTIATADRGSSGYATARAELQKAAEDAGDEQLAAEVRTAIDLREKFGVGNTAPDIQGIDLLGVSLKLSDYKGKVVLLDFWGDW